MIRINLAIPRYRRRTEKQLYEDMTRVAPDVRTPKEEVIREAVSEITRRRLGLKPGPRDAAINRRYETGE